MDWNESKAYIVPLQFPVIACIKYDILSLRKQSSDKKKKYRESGGVQTGVECLTFW